MIDAHCHILSGLDDGALDSDTSLLMAQMATEDGVTRIVATPHIRDHSPSPETIREETRRFNTRLDQWGLPLRVLPGAEVSLLTDLESIVRYTINNTSYILLELPPTLLPSRCKNNLFQLKIRGYHPIIAHPERHPAIIENPQPLIDWHGDGVKIQITADSLVGRFGPAAKKCALYLLKQDVVDIIASDAHSCGDRNPMLSQGIRIAARVVGRDRAFSLVTRNPLAVIQGRF